jgi:predicted PurR-regulated permease PerM
MRYQTLSFFVILILCAAGVALFILARPLVDSLLIAGLLAYLLDPLVRQVEKRFRLGRALAATLVYILKLLVVMGLITALALSGVLGALLIVPLLATCKIIGRYIHALLLGLPPWPPSPTPAAGSEPPLGCVDISGIRCHFEKERREIPQKVVGSKGD